MTNKILVVAALSISAVAIAQSDIDAMQYSQTSFYGDARFMSMGGAFGSLGANISCMNFNPAGIAMYHKGEFVFTPGLKFQGENASYRGTNASDFSSKFNISNIGFVAAWNQKQSTSQINNQPYTTDPYGPGSTQNQPSKPKVELPKFDRWAFGIDYNRIADFNYRTSVTGVAPASNSIMSSMADAAEGYTPDNLNQFYEGLGYATGAIIPVLPGTLNYDSTSGATHYAGQNAYTPGLTLQQSKTIQSSGRVGELAFALAHSFNDKLYLGGSIGVPIVKYNYQSVYTEYDYKNVDNVFKSIQYQENLLTNGAGVNFKAGGIYRFTSGVKVGLYGQTATYYTLTDNYQNMVTTNYDDSQYDNSSTSQLGVNKYHLKTPGRVGVSVSYVLGKLLAFSIDGEFVDYANARLTEKVVDSNTGISSNYFNPENLTIQNKYKGTANIKAGVELNIRPIVLRAGFASYGSPFGDVLSGKFVRNSFTGGIGFRGTHNVYLDLGFAYTIWAEKYYVIDPAYVQPANVNYSNLYITATLGIKFN